LIDSKLYAVISSNTEADRLYDMCLWLLLLFALQQSKAFQLLEGKDCKPQVAPGRQPLKTKQSA